MKAAMKILNSPPASAIETPKLPLSLSADPFSSESTSDYAPDSLSPSMESMLSNQGSDYDPDILRFPPPPPPDLKVDSFMDETHLCEQGLRFDLSGDSFAAVESEALSRKSEYPCDEGVGAGRSDSQVKYLSGSGVLPATATSECDEDPPWMKRYFLHQ